MRRSKRPPERYGESEGISEGACQRHAGPAREILRFRCADHPRAESGHRSARRALAAATQNSQGTTGMTIGKGFITTAIVLSLGAIGLSAAPARTSIVDAARQDNLARAKALVAAKANVNAPDVDGATALHWAVHHQDAAMVDLLLRAGAKPNATNREGVTPLEMAATYGDVGIISRLLKAGADP